MADTRQVVQWCLEYRCPLRSPEAENNPGKARIELFKAAYFSKSRRERQEGFGIYGDIVVTSHTFAQSKDGKPYPSDGYFFSQEFAAVGGPDAMLALCANCPANTTPDFCGGCTGSLMQFPESQETETQLQSILLRHGLKEAYSAQFLQTTPIWYGMWAQSPLASSAVKTLRAIISEMLAEDQNDQEAPRKDPRLKTHVAELTNFIRACDLAEEHDFKLHVLLAPLGHTDFGIYTIFPHCPACKAAAQIKHWQRKYPTAPYTCQACGQVFSPAATASREPMDMEPRGLRELLGQEQFEKFAEQYLISEGVPAEQAQAVVTATEEAERQRLSRWQQMRGAQKEWHESLRRMVREELGQALTIHAGDSEGNVGEPWPPKFNAPEFIEFYRRCRAKGLEFHSVSHESADEEMDRYLFQANTKDVEETVREWVAEGCCGLFAGHFLYRPKPANTSPTKQSDGV